MTFILLNHVGVSGPVFSEESWKVLDPEALKMTTDSYFYCFCLVRFLGAFGSRDPKNDDTFTLYFFLIAILGGSRTPRL